MPYKNIIHNLETLSEEQKSDLEIAETLLEKLNNLNNLKRSTYIETKVEYKDNEFIPNVGSYNTFIVDDIEYVIKNDLEKHIDFIYDTFRSEVSKFKDSNKRNREIIFKDKTSMLFEYYTDYPYERGSKEYSNAVSDLKAQVENVLLNK